MLQALHLSHVGPAPEMQLEFGKRLNLLTGDNGLGKSFILDIAWWALTRRWPAEVNPKLTAGLMARPNTPGKGQITFTIDAKSKPLKYTSTFAPQEQAWSTKQGRPTNSALVLYAQVDGSFAVWDPARNDWKKRNGDAPERPPAYVFSPTEIWNGLYDGQHIPLCNGLIQDWAGWQKENGQAFTHLKRVLESLSPSPQEPLTPGKLTRISLNDSRDIPTLKMPYGQEVPVLHASAGIRRILVLAYLLVWAWEEHLKASELLNQAPTSQIIFLIDEIEAHLHPKWQRHIIHALLSVIGNLDPNLEVQLITATHSPLVMASAESYFDPQQDAWFDLDFAPSNQQVVLTQRPFERLGDVSNWLTSEAFDLSSSYSLEAEQVLEKAIQAMRNANLEPRSAQEIHQQLLAVLSETDPFWLRWRYLGEKRGWLPPVGSPAP